MKSNPRIGIGFFYHESNTFSPVPTGLDAFQAEAYYVGQEILDNFSHTRTELGGFIEVLESNECTIVPLFCAAAIPSGPVTREAFEKIKSDATEALLAAGELDGLLLALHGAMVVDNLVSPEYQMLAHLRRLLGPQAPIATTLDMHANITADLLELTPLHFGFQTYPHVDMYEQGIRAAHALLHVLQEKTQYYASFVKLPLLLPSLNMRTADGPMQKVVDYAVQLEGQSGIEAVSVFGGFLYADVPEAGACVLVVAKDPRSADEAAKNTAKRLWDSRQEFLLPLPDAPMALEMALAALAKSKGPIALADISDNPLSGGLGDTTPLLREVIERDIPGSLFGALYDPESLRLCRAAGEGATLQLDLGGKIAPEFGEPISVEAQVIKLSPGQFINKGPMNTGRKVDTLGAAHIRVRNTDILITGRALTANDPELFRHIGIEPRDKTILALKVKNHFRAAFDEIVEEVIYVDSPGVASNQIDSFHFVRVPRPIWPLDEVSFTP